MNNQRKAFEALEENKGKFLPRSETGYRDTFVDRGYKMFCHGWKAFAEANICSRSHPHDDMNDACKLLSVQARNTALASQAQQLSGNSVQLSSNPLQLDDHIGNCNEVVRSILENPTNNHIPDGGEMVEKSLGNTEQLKLVQAVNALAAQTGESPESIIEWLTDKGGLTQLMLSYFGGVSKQAQQPKDKLNNLELRDFLECMQNGEMSVSRGLELIDLWLHGKYSNDLLPNYSSQPTLIEQLANAMQMHADMTAKYVAIVQSQAQQESRWISVDERLPEKFVDVLVHPRPTDYCCEAALHKDAWYWAEYESNFGEKRVKCKVTHWMPLPPAGE